MPSYRFDPAFLLDHFTGHPEVGTATAADYEARAAAFYAAPYNPNHWVGQDQDGDTLRFDPATGELVVVSPTGIIRTYYVRDRRKVRSDAAWWSKKVASGKGC